MYVRIISSPQIRTRFPPTNPLSPTPTLRAETWEKPGASEVSLLPKSPLALLPVLVLLVLLPAAKSVNLVRKVSSMLLKKQTAPDK